MSEVKEGLESETPTTNGEQSSTENLQAEEKNEVGSQENPGKENTTDGGDVDGSAGESFFF